MKQSSTMRVSRLVFLYTAVRLAVVAGCAGAAVAGVHLLGLEVSLTWTLLVGVLAGIAVSLVALHRLRTRINDEIRIIDNQRKYPPKRPRP
ncbi:DUF4229 domain-containing protein [Rhodococcus pyridinivorans]|uniref:DUF4229 domain-containing protein n=4 Tax=Rhodococcus TaxID=1827 RepID=H0JUG2_9NOCA|nr:MULTISPECIES: DUF4229 domain-containing protein [Rhodococcus]AOD24867.1 hypothetical protein IM25_24320 [Rhodococcus sp. p52]EHK82260.1 hypothetical protein AK37_16680 [Rhodococcus pyridinivorans AK37]MCD5422254.1 DUF4229 domain-containing protein [Rhodococcus pyridinivorans]MCT7293825.1 DUF4229 domain-containing protein [Rhodococcus sp. PAE-6]MCW3472171.1 DUF4229 domain-containing protein [Rhodococcus pyridinivorans]